MNAFENLGGLLLVVGLVAAALMVANTYGKRPTLLASVLRLFANITVLSGLTLLTIADTQAGYGWVPGAIFTALWSLSILLDVSAIRSAFT